MGKSVLCFVSTKITIGSDWGKINYFSNNRTASFMRAKNAEIIDAEACPDHIHMPVSIPPHISIAYLWDISREKRFNCFRPTLKLKIQIRLEKLSGTRILC